MSEGLFEPDVAAGGRMWREIADAVREGRACHEGVVGALGDAADDVECLLHRLDPTSGELVCVAATGPLGVATDTLRIPLGEGVAGWVASRRRPARVADRRRDPRGDHLTHLVASDGRARVGTVAVPVPYTPSQIGGVLEVCHVAGLLSGDDDVQVLQRAAALIGESADWQSLTAVRSTDRVARSVVAAQEAERARLAADIHDGVAQRLASLAFHLDAAAAAVGEDPSFAEAQIALARQLANLAAAETRAAIGGLRPPVLDDLGLVQALASLARTTPGVRVDTSGLTCRRRVPEHVQTAIYRIAQEALHNVVKHAQARQVWISLDCDRESLLLRVVDDGLGAPPQRPAPGRGLGLPGMRERADVIGGALHFRSRPGEGTTVEVRVSLDPVPS